MLQEAIQALDVREDGLYLDCTFGGGGHSTAILQRLSATGHLLAFDRDPYVLHISKQKNFADPRFHFVPGCYSKFPSVLANMQKIGQVQGILFDLGVSSMQLDDPGRGFSFRYDAPLDMRMNPHCGRSAQEWLNTTTESDIADVLYHYGDEKLARRIARGIIRQRALNNPICTTRQLSELVSTLYQRRKRRQRDIHPATKTFQAIRIFINRELDELRAALAAVPDALQAGGRLVTISFHALEDRIVKRFVRAQQRGGDVPASIPLPAAAMRPRLRPIGRTWRPSEQELRHNPRARSAVLRIAEKPRT